MTTKVLVKQLAGEEDLLLGKGAVTQNRNGTDLPITRVTLFKIVESEAELLAIDTAKFQFAKRIEGGYEYTYAFNGSSWTVAKQLIPVFANYSDIRAITTDGVPDTVYVAGRENALDGAGGFFTIDLADNTSADNDGTVLIDTLGRRRKRQYKAGEVLVSWFGAKIGEDITTPLTNAINAAKPQWETVVVDVIGTAYVSAALPQLNSSFNAVKIVGVSRKLTRLKFDGNGSTILAAPDGAISYAGGSGQIYGVGISDITIDGGTTVSPLLVKGFCGLVVQNCNVFAPIAATLSNDIGAGTFTEFFMFRNCDIRCFKVFTMRRGAGNDSFHGCGWDASCVINLSSGATSAVDIGSGEGSGRIIWYNAPIGGVVFAAAPSTITFVRLLNTATDNFVSTAGDIRFENNTNVKFASSNRVYHSGAITAIGGKFIMGAATHCARVDLPVSGSPSVVTMQNAKTFTKAAGGVLTVNIGGDSGAGSLLLVSATAANYEYQQFWMATGEISRGIARTTNLVATGRSFDAAGFGVPVLQWSGGSLQVYNANWGGVTATVRVTYLPASTFIGVPAEF